MGKNDCSLSTERQRKNISMEQQINIKTDIIIKHSCYITFSISGDLMTRNEVFFGKFFKTKQTQSEFYSHTAVCLAAGLMFAVTLFFCFPA